MSQLTFFDPTLAAVYSVVCLGGAYALLRKLDKSLANVLVLGLIVGLCLLRRDFGSPQQIFAVALIPWICLRLRDYQGDPPKTFWRAALTLLAATPVCAGSLFSADLISDLNFFDAPYVAILLCLEAIFLVSYRSKFKAVLLEPLIMLTAMVGTAIYRMLSEPNYSAIIGLKHIADLSFDPSLVAVGTTPDQTLTLYWFALSAMAAVFCIDRARPLERLLINIFIAMSAAGFVVYIFAKSGLSCDLQIMQFGLTALCAVLTCVVTAARPLQTALIGGSLVACALALNYGAMVNVDAAFAANSNADGLLKSIDGHSCTKLALIADYPEGAARLLAKPGRGVKTLTTRSLTLASLPAKGLLPIDEQKAVDVFAFKLRQDLADEISKADSDLICVQAPQAMLYFTQEPLRSAISLKYKNLGEARFYCSNTDGDQSAGGATSFVIWMRK